MNDRYEEPPRGSTAQSPDLNWSQVRETVLMLELAAAQISAAMRDSSASVEVLTGSFTTMVSHLHDITEILQALPSAMESETSKNKLLGASGEISDLVHQTIIAFQFYDKLAQRLAHVEHNLGSLSNLVADQRRLFNPTEWVDLQNQIRSKYTTREENAMFAAVMAGIPVHEAIHHYLAEMKEKGDDIELF